MSVPAGDGPDSELTDATIASELFDVLGTGRQIESVSRRVPSFDLARAYRVADAVRTSRQARGERVVGRKIGFTNRTIWAEYDVHHPIWGFVYDRTVHALAADARPSLRGLAEPRLEPEIIFGLARGPDAGMNPAEILGCVAWVAHGFEIVQSVYPGWRFSPADTVAAYGLHGALFVGPRHEVTALQRDRWVHDLSAFSIVLRKNGKDVDQGEAANVLGGPLFALAHLAEALDADPLSRPLAAGEMVTTGTLTRAFPIAPGETWSTVLDGVSLEPAEIRFADET